VYYVTGRDANSQCCQRGVNGSHWLPVHLSGKPDASLRALEDFERGEPPMREKTLFDSSSNDHLRFIISSRLHGPGPAKTK